MITSKNIELRDRVPLDSINEIIWQADIEVSQLDPTVGSIQITRLFSIYVNGVHIGLCGLYDQVGSIIQLGIRIGNKNYWNKGYGTEAVNLLLDYAFKELGIQKVWLKVLPWNTRAIRCYEKCGFGVSGILGLSGYTFIVMEVEKCSG